MTNRVIINKDGKPMVAQVDAQLFERIRRMQGRFYALCQRSKRTLQIRQRRKDSLKLRLPLSLSVRGMFDR